MTSVSEAEAREILGPETGFVRVSPQGILIVSGYSEALARLLRWVPKATWRPDMRAWLVPHAGADALRSVLPEIQRLAEAATEELQAERAASMTPVLDPETTKDWLAMLSEGVARGSADIDTFIAQASLAHRSEIERLAARLRSEAAKLFAAADRAEAWLKQRP